MSLLGSISTVLQRWRDLLQRLCISLARGSGGVDTYLQLILETVAKSLNLYKEYGDCREFVGEPWRAVEAVMGELRSGREFNYAELLEKQKWLEEAS
ncbi:MAG: hypothetical protein LM582_06110 [Desulfurococcaceae archaeon]|nr:hypothetical protein [Desulfurococcaceae archaeon]